MANENALIEYVDDSYYRNHFTAPGYWHGAQFYYDDTPDTDALSIVDAPLDLDAELSVDDEPVPYGLSIHPAALGAGDEWHRNDPRVQSWAMRPEAVRKREQTAGMVARIRARRERFHDAIARMAQHDADRAAAGGK